MDAAADLVADADRPGVILTTDADGRVGRRWLAANLAAVAARCRSGGRLCAGRPRRACATAGEHSSDAVGWRAATNGCWRNCRQGSISNRTTRGRAIGSPRAPAWPSPSTPTAGRAGCAPIPTGEDRALAEQVTDAGGRVRHSLAAQVAVSCRLDGRAAGGMAATIRQRALDPGPGLRPGLGAGPGLAAARALARPPCVACTGRHPPSPFEHWAALLQLTAAAARQGHGSEHFGAAWAVLEQASPVLAYRPLSPRELPGQIAVAERLLADLRRAILAARSRCSTSMR